MSLPTTASFVLNAIELPPSPLSLFSPSFLPVFVFLLHSTPCPPSSPPSPKKTFLPVIYRVTNGVPRGLYSRVAVTPLASSPWPAHAIYLSRLRDSIRLSFSPDRSPSFLLGSFRSIATSAPLHHSRRRNPPSIGIRGRCLFRAYFRYVPAARIFFPGSDSSQFTGSIRGFVRFDAFALV